MTSYVTGFPILLGCAKSHSSPFFCLHFFGEDETINVMKKKKTKSSTLVWGTVKKKGRSFSSSLLSPLSLSPPPKPTKKWMMMGSPSPPICLLMSFSTTATLFCVCTNVAKTSAERRGREEEGLDLPESVVFFLCWNNFLGKAKKRRERREGDGNMERKSESGEN